MIDRIELQRFLWLGADGGGMWIVLYIGWVAWGLLLILNFLGCKRYPYMNVGEEAV